MQQWFSYSLADLLLFSEQSYLRQFELYNQWLSPVGWLFYLYGILFLSALYKGQQQTLRMLFMGSAALWVLCSYGYLWQYYAAINWMAEYFIVLFVIQALLIIGVTRYSMPVPPVNRLKPNALLGLLLWVLSLIAQPVVEYLSGRALSELSVFAATPDSLACITIAFMLVLRLPAWSVIPAILWLIFSALTYIAMHNLNWIVPATGISLYLIALVVQQLSNQTR